MADSSQGSAWFTTQTADIISAATMPASPGRGQGYPPDKALRGPRPLVAVPVLYLEHQLLGLLRLPFVPDVALVTAA